MAFKNAQSPVGIHLLKADDLQTWFLSIKVLGDSLYQGEVFALKFVFEQNYPIEAPQMARRIRFPYILMSIQTAISVPVHWIPAGLQQSLPPSCNMRLPPVLTVLSVCLTLQSMLASNTKLERPEGNDKYVAHAPSNPKKT
ncbi:hypothetical protein QFC24_006950 [Naganishia onofrii]|uniref:Uncharacterized protein n=1 Tax=Naganishia onofrii TaxID=1851511 RepID=A0ACC2WUU1_9TREE|nr:hypothetical protein QFC24_006950 [Naganishia onofrii]